jgi:hypothetical protein
VIKSRIHPLPLLAPWSNDLAEQLGRARPDSAQRALLRFLPDGVCSVTTLLENTAQCAARDQSSALACG